SPGVVDLSWFSLKSNPSHSGQGLSHHFKTGQWKMPGTRPLYPAGVSQASLTCQGRAVLRRKSELLVGLCLLNGILFLVGQPYRAFPSRLASVPCTSRRTPHIACDLPSGSRQGVRFR